jgi:hypothetical protein
MTQQEVRELIDEYSGKIANVVFWAGISACVFVYGWPLLDAHNQHGKPIYEAAAKGDEDAIAIIRDAANGNPFWRWCLDAP